MHMSLTDVLGNLSPDFMGHIAWLEGATGRYFVLCDLQDTTSNDLILDDGCPLRHRLLGKWRHLRRDFEDRLWMWFKIFMRRMRDVRHGSSTVHESVFDKHGLEGNVFQPLGQNKCKINLVTKTFSRSLIIVHFPFSAWIVWGLCVCERERMGTRVRTQVCVCVHSIWFCSLVL